MAAKRQCLLVANRGEIAIRILHTAKKMGLRTVSVYTPSDSLAPHVSLADVSVPLLAQTSEWAAYQSAPAILSICQQEQVTMIHPGYGFISEDPDAATLFVDHGITWLGPRPEVIRMMGIKHEARAVAMKAGVPIVPGSGGVVEDEDEAVTLATTVVGYPVILKATAGGGGMGMTICHNERDLKDSFLRTVERAKALFGDGRVFLERYVAVSRHIEIQIFGFGNGRVIHMGERECSIQRRHQKVIEETPSPFLALHSGLREKMCSAAVQLGQAIDYTSAGTVEFVVDNLTGEFFFLEMNTRIQVEHSITESVRPGLDLIQYMIELGISEHLGSALEPSSRNQEVPAAEGHAIEVRVYSENPQEDFKPCPGVLQYVNLQEDAKYAWLRVDSWVATGTSISPYFDPLICKLVIHGGSRDEAISRLIKVLSEVKIHGPSNNLEYIGAVIDSSIFREGNATAQFLSTFKFTPSSFTVLSPGLDSSVQDFPGRTTGFGIPRSGPMDSIAFRIANALVGNPPSTEGIEAIVMPTFDVELYFHVVAVVSVTGKRVRVSVNGIQKAVWSKIHIPAGGKLLLQDLDEEDAEGGGSRSYIAFKGGFSHIPRYLNSKSTSMGMGGYQGRSLLAGDEIALNRLEVSEISSEWELSADLIPAYPSHWTIHVLPGPHGDSSYFTSSGIEGLYSTHWKVSASSNRMGIRLESEKNIEWAEVKAIGEGGSHPSNILDCGYAPGAVNINGDTPVILTVEGPDMGGFISAFTVCEADWWKTGQLKPGDTIRFVRVTWEKARSLRKTNEDYLDTVCASATRPSPTRTLLPTSPCEDVAYDPKLYFVPPSGSKPEVTFRLAGESCILVEMGEMKLDFTVRARIHAFEGEVRKRGPKGLSFSPCVRSTMVRYDPTVVSMNDIVQLLIESFKSTPDVTDITFSGRRITLPIVLDDHWNKEALSKYMKTIRDKAAYLPSNVEYLAKNNGLEGSTEVLEKLVKSDWLVIGVGFYLGLPFMVPIDPRCRIVGQKMNPSRTYTPRGAVGIAGVVAGIYPIESPGGYQLYGRTVPGWSTWSRGENFTTEQPWLFESFDQIRFQPVDEETYVAVERQFDAGKYTFNIEEVTFSLQEHMDFIESIKSEIDSFKTTQALAVTETSQNEQTLFREWTASKEVQRASLIAHHHGTSTISSPLSASIWKITIDLGQEIKSKHDVIMVLEAMKTEIPVKAGAQNIGKRVVGFSQLREGDVVRAGQVLAHLEDI